MPGTNFKNENVYTTIELVTSKYVEEPNVVLDIRPRLNERD